MLPTPSTSHVNYDHIYEPAEDSYLLLDTLSSASEKAFLHERFSDNSPTPFVLEVGTGSGVVIAFVTANAHEILGRHDVASIGSDVNVFACRASARTTELAIAETAASLKLEDKKPVLLSTIRGDLASSLKPGTVDVLIFNPPYVPTDKLPQHAGRQGEGEASSTTGIFERDSHLLSLSYAGGVDGMETTERLLAQIPFTLSHRGIAYVLFCAQNKPAQVADRIRSWPGGWTAQMVGSSGKTAGWEKLSVLRIWRGAASG